MVKCILILSLAAPSAIGQTATGSIQGTILDAKTLKPVSAAWVIASRAGAPPFTKNTKTGGDGAFQIQGLMAGNYSLCVQVAGDQYLDPCLWNGIPAAVTVSYGQALSGISVKLAAASVLRSPRRTIIQLSSAAARGMASPGRALRRSIDASTASASTSTP